MLDKDFGQITPEDVTNLCKDGVYENQLLEFKRDLPAERNRPDPWLTGGDFTAYARDHLLREVVAFANAQGGTVIVGIDQTRDDPPRAAAVCALPRIHDLATRMENAARACIDPVLPGLQIRGIEVGGDGAGHGVLLFRTGPSLAGPHRVANDGHAYIRRGTSAVKMTMREIQDLTIDHLRGADRLEGIFQKRDTGFKESLEFVNTEHGACRITAVPLGGFPGIPRLSGNPGDFPIRSRFGANVGVDLALAGPTFDRFRQIVRGFRWSKDDDSVKYEVYEAGLIDLWYRHAPVDRPRIHFFIGWLLGAYLSVLEAIDTARTMANVPDWEFAVEFVLDGITGAPRPGGGKAPLGALVIGKFNEPYEMGRIEGLPLRFPRIPYRSRADRERVLNLVWADLVDAMGGPRGNGVIRLL